MPLSKYLLDGDFAGEQESYKTTESKESKFDPLSKSGLPVGFRIFIKSKMNTSQLQAITASSKEYGSGGFTLIKGPPGTGKVKCVMDYYSVRFFILIHPHFPSSVNHSRFNTQCAALTTIPRVLQRD